MNKGLLLALGFSVAVLAQQPAVQLPVIPPVWVAVRPIEPPAAPLPDTIISTITSSSTTSTAA